MKRKLLLHQYEYICALYVQLYNASETGRKNRSESCMCLSKRAPVLLLLSFYVFHFCFSSRARYYDVLHILLEDSLTNRCFKNKCGDWNRSGGNLATVSHIYCTRLSAGPTIGNIAYGIYSQKIVLYGLWGNIRAYFRHFSGILYAFIYLKAFLKIVIISLFLRLFYKCRQRSKLNENNFRSFFHSIFSEYLRGYFDTFRGNTKKIFHNLNTIFGRPWLSVFIYLHCTKGSADSNLYYACNHHIEFCSAILRSPRRMLHIASTFFIPFRSILKFLFLASLRELLGEYNTWILAAFHADVVVVPFASYIFF